MNVIFPDGALFNVGQIIYLTLLMENKKMKYRIACKAQMSRLMILAFLSIIMRPSVSFADENGPWYWWGGNSDIFATGYNWAQYYYPNHNPDQYDTLVIGKEMQGN